MYFGHRPKSNMLYLNVFGMIPPCICSLNINWTRLQLFDEFFGPVGESSGRVGCANEIKLPVGLGVFQYGEGVVERVISIGDSMINGAAQIRLSEESMDNFVTYAHVYIIWCWVIIKNLPTFTVNLVENSQDL